MDELTKATSSEILSLVKKRALSCEELARHCLDAIDRYNPVLGCFITVAPGEEILRKARESDDRRARGEERSALDGVPVAVKDNIHAEGLPTTCASAILGEYRPPFDATAVSRLKEAGALVIGKTNMDEFAMGSTCENSAIKITRNPWDIERVPGGSSGGSAAAVAAGMAPLALGSDTGGSIRQPAAFCGVAGMKPTYGLVSRYGLVAYASSLDQVGPLARDARACGVLLDAIRGFDPRDSTSLGEDLRQGPGKKIRGLRVALLPELFREGISPLVRESFDDSIAVLRGLGATLEDASMPSLQYAVSTYYFIACAEASSNLSRFDGVKYGVRGDGQRDYREMLFSTRTSGFGREVKKRILLGNFVLSSGYYDEYYRAALRVRAFIRNEIMEILKSFDAIAIPSTPDIAFPLGESLADPMKIYLSDVTTVIANLAGLPALSIPSGTVHGMPVGLQLMGRPLEERLLIEIAAAFEATRPPLPPPPLERIDGSEAAGSVPGTPKNGRNGTAASAYSPEFIAGLSRAYGNPRPQAERVLCRDLETIVGSTATIAGWIHRIKSLGGIEFYEIRDRSGFIQLVLEGGARAEDITPESVVEVSGLVTREERSPFGGIEMKVARMNILARAEAGVPVAVNRPPGNVSLPAILDNRAVSLRNPEILDVFRLQSEIAGLFAAHLRENRFAEIKTPKIISSGTEGGTNIFKVNYFGRTACLAQSPQFYKQIMVGSGMERVFETGPVFRAEHHDTARHLNEYVSMDFEMAFIRDEEDVIDMQEGLLRFLFARLAETCGDILEGAGASISFPERIPRVHYLEALEIVRSAGGRLEEGDISPEGEKILCTHFERERGSEFVYVIGYPVKKRPMYTMPDERVPGYTRSFDLLYRGIEITTGGQRIHDYEALRENMRMLGFNPAEFRHYLEAFRYGMPPHGGLGMGLERLTMKIMGLNNIREASLFPRDMQRIAP
ncbi:MAG: Asp-tRNA(Asn)/Glu-tRNA(Gln) amidotransferase subunit GatA [Spirochaetes bacterium]|nr:Asp-tRNA(Asn)/Glu-tRNA(Gln) amidotransferase subunit GatA [Spirochaetota bacterium]